MDTGQSPRPGRRGRIIAGVAGAITVTAIVVAFAAEYFELPWKWPRPGLELLLLAELVGLVVLERHQLFEPVNEKVTGIEASIADLRSTLNELKKQLAATGQVTLAVGVRETLQLRTRLLQEALERDQGGPQVIRIALLSGSMVTQDTRELGDELEVFIRTMSQFRLVADGPMTQKAIDGPYGQLWHGEPRRHSEAESSTFVPSPGTGPSTRSSKSLCARDRRV
jgi:hypothetical protein